MTPDMVRRRPRYRPSIYVIAVCVITAYGAVVLFVAHGRGFWPWGG